MIVLGIDPGNTSGWCRYDSSTRTVIDSGQVPGHEANAPLECDAAVIERPKGYGATYPQVVDCGYTCGRLVGLLEAAGLSVEELTRLDVRKALSEETHGVVRVKNDATAWLALKELHGGESAGKKGGPLYGVRSHERAALAVAVAFLLRGDR